MKSSPTTSHLPTTPDHSTTPSPIHQTQKSRDRKGAGSAPPLLLLILLLLPTLHAEVSGTVTNQTTGKPQPNATVTLYKLGGAGMETVVSVKSGPTGEFKMPETPKGPHLIQTAFDGVTYNHMLPPGSSPTGLNLTVYNSSKKKPAAVKPSTHMILLEPSADALNVSESVIYKNEGQVSYNDPDGGTFRVAIPEASAPKAKAMATAPQGMPVERALEKTSTPGLYKVDFPIKPGETRFDVTYAAPPTTEFSTKVPEGDSIRFVAPSGVTLTSDALKLLGQEPQSQASIYQTTKPEVTVKIEGTGSIQGGGGGGGEGDEEGGEGLKQIRPRVYERFYLILGFSLVILVLTFVLLYRKHSPVPAVSAAAKPAPAAAKPKRKA